MKLNQIEYVYEVFRCGSITAASKKLFVTQPTLSQQIMALENELHVKLFLRDAKKMILTSAGEEFVVFAERILNDISRLNETMDDYAALRRGRIRVGFYSTINNQIPVVKKITRFHNEFPSINIHITIAFSQALAEMLLSHQLDVIFCVSNPKIEHAITVQIGGMSENILALVPQNHPLAKNKSITFYDLNEEMVVLPSKYSSLHQTIVDYFKEANSMPKIICETSDPNVYLELVGNGMGIGFAAKSIDTSPFSAPISWIPLEKQIGCSARLICLEDSYKIPAIQHFIDYFRSAK